MQTKKKISDKRPLYRKESYVFYFSSDIDKKCHDNQNQPAKIMFHLLENALTNF